jgi:nicotinate-nucleotide adenylyltransferase
MNALPHWKNTTAIFGGRFDPPHLGHREAVLGLLESPGVENVLVIPTGSPPHKKTFLSIQDRAELCRLNFTFAEPLLAQRIQLDFQELDRASSFPQTPSYSFDTLKRLQAKKLNLAFVLGSDQLTYLPKWHRFPEILDLCHWIVLGRKPHGLAKARQTLQDWQEQALIKEIAPHYWVNLRSAKTCFHLTSTQATQCSSTEIRHFLSQKGAPPPHTLLSEVDTYLKKHALYSSMYL